MALGVWLEYFLHKFPQAKYMMTQGCPPENATKEQHEKFTKTISKTYRNRLVQVVFKNPEFKSIYKGSDNRPLGLHSKRKMGSTQAKRRGSPAEHVDHRGRWVAKKGSRIVNSVYIDPEDEYADASVASNLCLGGPIKYKLHDQLAGHITTDWLGEHVVPNIAKRYAGDPSLVRSLGLAMLYALMDVEVSEDLCLTLAQVEAVHAAYKELPVEDKPEQPVLRIPLHVYRIGETTYIDEVWNNTGRAAAGRGGGDGATAAEQPMTTVADSLARVPASGGSAATQQVLQTLLIQNQQLLRKIEELEKRMDTRDQTTRAWQEDKFRRLNDNIRRFGGTIQGGMVRQQPNRAAEVRRYNAEQQQRAPEVATRGGRGRVWPTLCPNINSLMSLWSEYEFGVGGRKAAKLWTPAERGNPKQKQTFYRRNCVWKIQLHLINKDYNVTAANALIRATYGERTSITNIAKAIVADRTRYKVHGGLHPNFR